jgi:endonuclease/exonuclease/phosphatase family metal-dependent hydrolase
MARVDGLLSWNMDCGPHSDTDATTTKRRLALLSSMLAERSPTLIAIQEAPSVAKLRNTLGLSFDVERTPNGVATAYDTRFWSCDRRHGSDPRVAVLGLRGTGAGTNLWMLNLHGPALYVELADKQDFVRDVSRLLATLRESDANRREVVVGDLNLPPFDPSVMRKRHGLHASRCLPWVADRASGLDRALFNPTWKILGDHSGPSGTLYKGDITFDGPWRATDQVMVSAELARHLTIEVVEKVGVQALRKLGRMGAPDRSTGSDHLPLFAKLSIP